MKKIISVLLGLFISIIIVKGQNSSDSSTSMKMGGGGFTIGYGYMDVSKLQIFLPENFPKLRNDHLVIGGTGHGIINNFVMGGSGFGMIGDLIVSDSINASVGGGMGTFDFGYLILNKNKVKIFPLIGIGGEGYGVKISNHKNVSVENLSKNPGQEINISKGGFVADLSLNINLIPAMEYNENKKSYGGFMTGIKVGYVYSLPTSNWHFSGGSISGAPNFGLSMAYVKLIIGGFGSQKK